MFTDGTNMSTTSPITLPTTRGSTDAAMMITTKAMHNRLSLEEGISSSAFGGGSVFQVCSGVGFI